MIIGVSFFMNMFQGFSLVYDPENGTISVQRICAPDGSLDQTTLAMEESEPISNVSWTTPS